MTATFDTGWLMPTTAYHDREWFHRELRAIFTKRWAHIGAIDDLREPGDFITANVGTAPLVVVVGQDGELRAFHNMCRHRGMAMLEGRGNCGNAIDCFYHRWRFGLEGDLLLVPQRKEQFPDMVLEDWGLLPASVGVWEGLVFAHPDPEASGFAGIATALTDHVGSFRPSELVQTVTHSFDAHCNWKLFVENHIDVYHLWYLHDETLGDFDHTRFEYVEQDGNWFSHEPIRADRRGLSTGQPPIAHLSEGQRDLLGAHMIFPNTLFATSSEFFATYVAVPIAPDRSRIDLRVRAEAGADAATLQAALASFIEEDILACERIQAVVESPVFEVGPLAREHEHPITAFHRDVIAQLECERP